MNFRQKIAIGSIAIGLALLGITFGIAPSYLSAKYPRYPVQTAAATTVPADPAKPEISVEERLSAFYRAHPNSIMVCYDSNYDGFFLHYKDITLGEDYPTDRFYGWYLIQKVIFYQAANNIWFTGESLDPAYIKVYPVVTGLPCKEVHD